MANDPKVRIVIEGDPSHALKQIKAVEKGLSAMGGKPMKDPTGSVRKGLKETAKEVDRTQKKMGGFANFMASVGGKLASVFAVGAITKFAKDTVNAAVQAESAFKGLESVANRTGIGIERAWSDASKIAADGMMTQAEAATALKNLYARGFSADEAVKMLERIKDAAAFGRQSSLEFGEAVVSATEGLKNENSVLVDNAGITKNVAKMWEDYAKAQGKSVAHLTDAEKRQAEYNGIMAETAAQVGDTQKALDGYQGQQAQLAQKIDELKTKIGEALTPAFTGLATAVIWLIDNAFRPAVGWLQKFGAKAAQFAADVGATWRYIRTRDLEAFRREIKQNQKIYDEVAADIDRKINSKGPSIADGARDNIDHEAVRKRQEEEARQKLQAEQKVEEERKEKAKRAAIEARREAKRQRQAETKELFADLNARLAVEENAIAKASATLEADYKKRLVSHEDYLKQKAALDQRALDVERERLEGHLAIIEQMQAKTADLEDRQEYAAQAKELRRELEALKAEEHKIKVNLEADTYQLERELRDLQLDVRVRLLDASGKTLEARLAEIRAATEEALSDPRLAGDDPTGEKVRTKRDLLDLQSMSEARARYDDAQSNIRLERARLGITEQRLQHRLSQGQISQLEYDRQLQAAKTATADAIERYTKAMRQAAEVTGDPAMQVGIEQITQDLVEMRTRVDEVSATIRTSFTGELTNAFKAILTGTKSASAAFKDMARSVIASIQEIIAQKLAMAMVDRLLGGGGGGWVGTAANFIGSMFASGGYVRGPGTGTSDSIPARLSNGEYVIRAAAVKAIGVDTLNQLNQSGRLPARFAEGGLVGTAPLGGRGQGSEAAVNVKIVNVLDPSVVENAFAGSAFEKQVMNVISKNPAGVRQATGI